MHNMGSLYRGAFIIVFICLLGVSCAANAADTMLMFVGEDLEVLSIASRRKEAAWSAPAIADVVTREEIDFQNSFSIAEALENRPGFHRDATEKNSILYLRGIQNSALFLYDTVPLGSGIRKSDTFLDHEISLAAVKRIEIVRGPGSVLWGPDAFAGVVNVVPLSGKDLDGGQTGLILSSQDEFREAFFNYGREGEGWTSFFSVSGSSQEESTTANVVAFWENGEAPASTSVRYGEKTAGEAAFLNAYAGMTWHDWLTISFRGGDTRNSAVLHDWDHVYSWEETTETTSSVLKLEAVKKVSQDSAFRFTGYYSWADKDTTVVDLELKSSESSWYGEIIYDQSVLQSRGLFTLGSSLRQNEFNDIPVWGSFFPDFFVSENENFLPRVAQVDFENRLTSFFCQYLHDFDVVEIWAGSRYDHHDEYENKISYSAGLTWDLGRYTAKLIYGTAYRTPYARQIQEADQDKLEKNSNLNFQVAWKDADSRAAITLFQNKIANHVVEDRFAGAGLSIPNNQTINGVEVELEQRLGENFFLSGNVIFLDNHGPDEIYLFNDYDYIDQDGNVVDHYRIYEHGYDAGPDISGVVKGKWRISENVSVMPVMRFFSEQTLYYPAEDVTRECDGGWIMDVNLLVGNVFPFDATFYVKNVFDKRYLTPGEYSVTKTDGFRAGVVFRLAW